MLLRGPPPREDIPMTTRWLTLALLLPLAAGAIEPYQAQPVQPQQAAPVQPAQPSQVAPAAPAAGRSVPTPAPAVHPAASAPTAPARPENPDYLFTTYQCYRLGFNSQVMI